MSLHYAYKRDIRTFEHQLHRLNQKGMKINEFYTKVNHQFSIIINKIKTESFSEETVRVVVDIYWNRALEVFIRGLRGDISRSLLIQRPETLPEAHSACLQIQNVELRNSPNRNQSINKKVSVPINNLSSNLSGKKWVSNAISVNKIQLFQRYPHQRNQNSSSFDLNLNMNYMNRPNHFKRSTRSEKYPR